MNEPKKLSVDQAAIVLRDGKKVSCDKPSIPEIPKLVASDFSIAEVIRKEPSWTNHK